MPSRGGRGRGRGGSRGGGNFRFRLSKSLKRRAARSNKHDMPELMDLGEDVYLPEKGDDMPRASMKTLLRRPNRHMMDEARNTDRNMERTIAQPLRYRRIEFVKAEQVYDPSRDLVKQLEKYNEEKEETKELSDHLETLKVVTATTATTETTEVTETVTTVAETATAEVTEEESGEDSVSVAEPIETVDLIVPEVEEEKSAEGDVDESDSLDEPRKTDSAETDAETAETGETAQIGETNETDFAETAAEAGAEVGDIDIAVDVPSDSHPSDADEESFVIDEDADEAVLAKHKVHKPVTSVLLQQAHRRPKPAPPKREALFDPVIEIDDYITVGNVMMRTLKADDGSVVASLPKLSNLRKVTTTGFEESEPEEESEDSDENAAFEDYMAQLMEANAKDDEEEMDESEEEDVYISSDLDDYMSDNDDQYLNSDEEGLEEIVAFARGQQKNLAELDIPPTQTLTTKGKGKKQRLELGSELEVELRESLMEQFQYQKTSRRDKKLRKKEKKKQEALELNDLNTKYDYSIHIKEIKQEFEMFLHDVSRESLSFPPLDSHGNKTISKLAGYYNMKCIRSGGNGLSMFMKVAKTKKTFRYVPAYDLILYIMKQRPVFRRSDVKSRPKEEIAETDGKKTRLHDRSNAHVPEGHIVGGEAPEISSTNIGRQLLEKLGWVKGEGLGALGNKGISEPLTATVKKSKTGLK